MKRRWNQEYHSFATIIESVKDIRIDEKRRISFLRHDKIVSFIFLVTDGLNEDRISRMKEESRIRVYLSFTVEGYQNQDGKKGISFFFFYQKILYPFFFIVANIKIVNRKEFFFFRHCEYSTIEVQNTFPSSFETYWKSRLSFISIYRLLSFCKCDSSSRNVRVYQFNWVYFYSPGIVIIIRCIYSLGIVVFHSN